VLSASIASLQFFESNSKEINKTEYLENRSLYILSLCCNHMNLKLWTFNKAISTAITMALAVGFIAFPIFAQTAPPATTITSQPSSNATLDSILGAPFFEDMGSKVTGTRVISTDPVQTEDSSVANVTIRGVGNVTDTGTFITTHKPGGVTTSEGQGIISTADGEIATYTAQDLGFTNETGYTTYRGIQIFATNSIGKMAFMDNLVGLYVYENDTEGDRISGKIWEWK
jgi:hypothetical protein